MSRFRFTLAAEQDLGEIAEYIARDSSAAAAKLLDKLEARCRALAQMPESGVPRDEIAPGVRSAAVGKYVIFYCYADEGTEILRVLHGSRDVQANF